VRQREEIVEGIPVVLVEPDEQRGAPVLWMSYLGGYGERNLPMLEGFAAAGHPAASFDAPGHGARGSGDRQEFARHVAALDPPSSATVEINVHPGLEHGVVSDQAAKDAAFAFLLDPA
jgi:alpha-beta hydrolase superfamily lysophospholipase